MGPDEPQVRHQLTSVSLSLLSGVFLGSSFGPVRPAGRSTWIPRAAREVRRRSKAGLQALRRSQSTAEQPSAGTMRTKTPASSQEPCSGEAKMCGYDPRISVWSTAAAILAPFSPSLQAGAAEARLDRSRHISEPAPYNVAEGLRRLLTSFTTFPFGEMGVTGCHGGLSLRTGTRDGMEPRIRERHQACPRA